MLNNITETPQSIQNNLKAQVRQYLKNVNSPQKPQLIKTTLTKTITTQPIIISNSKNTTLQRIEPQTISIYNTLNPNNPKKRIITSIVDIKSLNPPHNTLLTVEITLLANTYTYHYNPQLAKQQNIPSTLYPIYDLLKSQQQTTTEENTNIYHLASTIFIDYIIKQLKEYKNPYNIAYLTPIHSIETNRY